MKIAFTGGKGGTGKSTVAVLFANELVLQKKKVVLCDCDVECPNDYLLLNQKLDKGKEITADFPKLNKEKCQKCGLCVKTCQNNAIFQAPGKYPLFIKDLCSACLACKIVCPHNAIETDKEKIGSIFLNKVKDNLALVTGIAEPFLEETGPIVAATKKFALTQKADFFLFDTAAGTHCSVIAALLGCDLAYAITEPTPMGAYDLELILDLCSKIKIPVKVILNQADLGDKKGVEKIVKKFNTEIVKEIPYSKRIMRLYAKGKLKDLCL